MPPRAPFSQPQSLSAAPPAPSDLEEKGTEKGTENQNDEEGFEVFSLFNTYEKGCLIRTPNGPSYRFLLSIGDVIQEDETSVYTKTSDSTTVYISRDMLGALMITGLALKYGAIGALSMITGMAIKGLFVVPVAIGGAILFPVFATIGGSIVLLGITLKTAIAGATLVALTPNAASLICLYLLANRYARG